MSTGGDPIILSSGLDSTNDSLISYRADIETTVSKTGEYKALDVNLLSEKCFEILGCLRSQEKTAMNSITGLAQEQARRNRSTEKLVAVLETLINQFQTGYDSHLDAYCMKTYGLGSSMSDSFTTLAAPRIADVFLQSMDSDEHRFENLSKDTQMNFVILGRLIAESSFELSDAARWKKTRFSVESGQHWRGPKTPSRIESHVKRDGKVALGSCIKLVQPHNYFTSRDRATDLVSSQLRKIVS